jgi:glycosyltransferase involved in cell wall biosynthesis
LHGDVDFALPARRIPFLGHPDRWTAALAWLRDLDSVDPGPVDLVVSQELSNPGSLQASRLAQRLGVPHVVLIFEVLRNSPLYMLPPWRQIARRVSRSGDGFLCFTETARQHAMARKSPEYLCDVVYLGVDTRRFCPAEARTTEAIVAFVGELRPDKGVRDLVKACETAVGHGTDLTLRIIGDGPLRAELEAARDRLPFLEVLGRRPRDEVPDLLRGARVVGVPSRSRPFWAEQFGFALVEAMATGLPVVTTRCGALPEVVPEWNPIVDEGDVSALSDAIVTALGSAGDEWGAKNRQYVLDHYDIDRQGVAFGDALRAVVQRGRRDI